MEIKKLKPDEISDFRSLVEIFKTVFENEEPIADQDQLGKLLADPDFMVFVVRQDHKIAGGLTSYVLVLRDKTSGLPL